MKSRRKKKPLKLLEDDGMPFGWYKRLLDLGLVEMPKMLYDTEPMKIDDMKPLTYFENPPK